MDDHRNLSAEELRARIKKLESEAHTAQTSPELDALNREQTRRLSDNELLSLIQTRAAQGKPIGKLKPAARNRVLSF